MTRLKQRIFRLSKTTVPGEYTGDVWLLKRTDPLLWFGSARGEVFTGTIVPNAGFDEQQFRQPLKLHSQSRVSGPEPYRRTMALPLVRHGAFVRSARDGKGRQLTMKAFVHESGAYIVAGWDPARKAWVVE